MAGYLFSIQASPVFLTMIYVIHFFNTLAKGIIHACKMFIFKTSCCIHMTGWKRAKWTVVYFSNPRMTIAQFKFLAYILIVFTIWITIRQSFILQFPIMVSKQNTVVFQEKTCQPKIFVVFQKNHKCAGTTIQNILFRYAYKHELNVVLPSKVGAWKGGVKTQDFFDYPSTILPNFSLILNIFSLIQGL